MQLHKIKKTAQIQVREDVSLSLVVVSDTHSTPHSRALEIITGLHPDAIIHAGDVGEFRVLDELAAICPVYAVRGNVDHASQDLPDTLVIEICSKEALILRILTLHVGIYGAKLRSEVAQMARNETASLVVCGHSHIPFIGNDRGIAIFNPGSIGPRRFGLPIVFGVIQISASSVQLSHVDCETGLPWKPPTPKH
jgi:putative phosphoesterase